jgi:DNA-binding NtrC family response regulator
LVVESDESQRSLVGALLEESDMTVVQCVSAESAVLILNQSGDSVSMAGGSLSAPARSGIHRLDHFAQPAFDAQFTQQSFCRGGVAGAFTVA